MSVTTVKVPSELRDQLLERAEAEGVPISSVIESALAALIEQERWRSIEVGYHGLRKNSKAWREYVQERDEWLAF